MIDRGHGLPLRRQAEVLRLSRSSLYYQPRPVPAADLAIMRRMRIEALYRRAEYLQTCCWAQDLPVSAAWP